MLVEKLSHQANVGENKIRFLALTASRRYKTYEIPKRGGGTRVIEHPSRALKSIQRWLSKEVTSSLPVHECATAYRKGVSILDNADRHKDTRYTVRHDFKSFFPSFHAERIRTFLIGCRELGYLDISNDDIDFFIMCVTRNDCLTIGAPSSPPLTNAMMYSFDTRLAKDCEERGLIYSRYADDIFISSFSADNLGETVNMIDKARKGIPHLFLVLNKSKTVHTSKKHLRQITGLVVTPQGCVSIGRDRKREIKALVHRFSLGQLDTTEIAYLSGWVAYIHGVEPSFRRSLEKKYGNNVIEELLKGPTVQGSSATP